MTPNTVQKTIKSMGAKSARLNVCWSGMIPWVAEWVANIKNETVEKVLDVTRENAKRMYGIMA
jgi:Tat protein secretion system quality control protein TatD with DNase activity